MEKLIADEHVERALVSGLRLKDVDVVTAQECGLTGFDDEDLLAFATADGRIVITNDKDFPAIHAAWLAASRPHGGIIYWRQTKYSVGHAIRRIVAVMKFPTIDPVNALIYL